MIEVSGMDIMDTMMIICWAMAYLLMVWNGELFSAKAHLMIPTLACAFNISWELVAMIYSHGNLGHIVWFFLDVGVFLLCLKYIYKKAKKAIIYTAVYIIVTILFVQIAYEVFKFRNGMLFSSFVINLIMSVMFVVFEKQISEKGKVSIAVLKMLGTMCATLSAGKGFVFLEIIGLVIFLVDLFYVALCMERQAVRKNKRGKR